MDEDLSFDLLSSSPGLPRICEYLNPNDVLRCLRVNKHISVSIKDNWNKMRRKSAQVIISSREHEINGAMHSKKDALTICCVVGPQWQRRQIYLEMEESYVFGCGIRSSYFLHALKRKQASSGRVIKMRFDHEEYKLISDSGQTLRDVLMTLLPMVELHTFEMTEVITKPEYTKFTNHQLTCIRDCLIESKGTVRTLFGTTAQLNASEQIHTEILRAADLDRARIIAMNKLCLSASFLNLPTDLRGYLIIDIECEILSAFYGLQLLFQEWTKGTKAVTRFLVNLNTDADEFFKGEVLQILSYMPNHRVDLEDDYTVLGQMNRKIDNMALLFRIKPGQYEFWNPRRMH